MPDEGIEYGTFRLLLQFLIGKNSPEVFAILGSLQAEFVPREVDRMFVRKVVVFLSGSIFAQLAKLVLGLPGIRIGAGVAVDRRGLVFFRTFYISSQEAQ